MKGKKKGKWENVSRTKERRIKQMIIPADFDGGALIGNRIDRIKWDWNYNVSLLIRSPI
jgi:hypothetical protein